MQLDEILHGDERMAFILDGEGELAVLGSKIYKMTMRLRYRAGANSLLNFIVKKSTLRYSDYFAVMPVFPMAIFTGIILLSVGLAYYAAGRKIAGSNIVDGLRDDTRY